jgi:ribonuclease P protein component|tara:strand:- start:76 stop:420 length:345 start_codon:yes stop_codon:yes gene_type:complete
MLYAKHRLAKRADIERVFKKGRSFFVGNIGIRIAKNNLKVSRFTVVASLKVSKKAVDRNKLKRKLREIIRKEILPSVKPGFDGVISTKKPLLELSYNELQSLTIKLFKKTKLLS